MATITYFKQQPYSPPPPPRDEKSILAWLARFASELAPVLDPITRQPGQDYALVEGVAFAGGAAVLVPHGLGRSATHFRVVDVNADTRFYRTTPAGLDPAKHISIHSVSACTASFEVY
jgi:hypothetical protein